jgi:hypothetical protein
MKVNLIKDTSLGKETFTQVFDILNAISGPIKFCCDGDSLIDFNEDEYFENTIETVKDFRIKKQILSESMMYSERLSFPLTRNTATWNTLFKKCNQYRKLHNIDSSEFVLLLTELPNDKNWFAALDEQMPFNGFIHTQDWSEYINCNEAFPIAYEVIALVLQKHIFNGIKELRTEVHQLPIGCINDFCMHKQEIILKLRTADICNVCMEKLKDQLPAPTIHHALDILESLRKKMLYAQNFKQQSPLSRLIVDNQKNIFLPDFENIQIRLNPLEKTLYMLYLFHPEGIEISSLCDYKEEMYHIYTNISTRGDLQEMKSKIDRIANVTTNSASEKISKIKEKFSSAIGSELAKNYYIHGANATTRKISLDRKLVDIN